MGRHLVDAETVVVALVAGEIVVDPHENGLAVANLQQWDAAARPISAGAVVPDAIGFLFRQ